MRVEEIVYFDELGKVNTEDTLRLAREKAKSRSINNVLIATHRGITAEKALEVFKDSDISLTFVGSTREWFSIETYAKVLEHGHKVAFANEYGHELPDVANLVFRRFCEGMRVAIRIMIVATDLNLIPTGELVISVAGTGFFHFEEKGGGADTAIIVTSCKGEDFFTKRSSKPDRRNIHEIICKPA